ncbi:MAG: phosphatase PAP2 family protein [Ruminococcus sp.]|nr:phosphatase PAP2 family protein [Ruminococcus sp.]
MDELMPKITLLGDKGLFFIFIAIVMLFFKPYRHCGIACLTGLMCGVIIGNLIVKNIVRRSRPCWINDTVNMLIEIPKDYSFPSGHTLAAFISASVMMHYDKRIGIPALIIACAIAFSRMYLYVHFPTDILSGIVLGTLIGCTVVHCLDNYLFN